MALNYRTEPFSYRFQNQDYLVNDPALSPKGIARGQSDTLVSADPQTPVFVAGAGTPFRLRALHPAGLSEQVFEIHGHAWQEEPYSKGSLQIAAYNPLSQWTGSRDTFGANSAFDAVLAHAGGSHGVKGDYLFRTFIAQNFQNGMWGLLRVGDPGKDVVTVTNFCPAQGSFTVGGVNTVNPSNNRLPSSVTITGANLQPTNVPVDQSTGLWQRSFANAIAPATITVTSTEGGTSTTAELCPVAGTPARFARNVHVPRISNDNVNRFLPQPKTLKNPEPTPNVHAPPISNDDVNRFLPQPKTLKNPEPTPNVKKK
jgi:hypothetical protein